MEDIIRIYIYILEIIRKYNLALVFYIYYLVLVFYRFTTSSIT